MAALHFFSCLLFSIFLAVQGSKCPTLEAPSKHIVCYYEGTAALEDVNLCNCTHLVFTNIATAESFNLTFSKDVKLNERAALEAKNLSLIFTVNLKPSQTSAVLKSEDKKIDLLNSISTFLRTSQFSGVELNFEFSVDDSSRKDALVSFVKDLHSLLDHHRVKRDGYSVFEDQIDDFTTGRYTTEKYIQPKSPTTKKSVIKRKKNRISRDDKNVDFYDEDDSEISVVEEYLEDEPLLKRTKRRKQRVDEEGELKEENEGATDAGYIIMLRLSITPEIMVKKYDLKALSKYVDFMIVPTHMITDETEKHVTFHPSRLMGLADILNTDSILDLLTGLGAPKPQLIISMPASVLQYQLKDADKNTARSPTIGDPQVVTQAKMCNLLKSGDWTVERDEDLTAPYAFSKTTWLAFEDEISVNIKGKYIILRELAGGAVYPIDSDIKSDACAQKQGGRIAGALQNNFGGLARKPRQVVLESLQEQIHDTAFFSQEAGVHLSEYRIVRVVDHSGAVHVIRKNTKTEFECSRQGYFSHPLGCNKFYRCVKFNQYTDDYTVFEYDCPAGLAFDERWEVCVWPGSLPHGAPCTGSSEIAPVPRAYYQCPNAEGYYADPENCRWFFACLDHARDGVTPLTAYEFRCPFGLVFDEGKLACDWPWLVGGCGARGAAGVVITRAGGASAYAGSATGINAGGTYINGLLQDQQNRASFATVPDYVISGGRIANKAGGVILNQNLLGGLGGPAGVQVAASPIVQTLQPPVVGVVDARKNIGSFLSAPGSIGSGTAYLATVTPSSIIAEDGGSKHRENGFQTLQVSTPASFLVEDGGSRHRENLLQTLQQNTPSSFLAEDGGSRHRENVLQALQGNRPAGFLVEDGGSRHRSNGLQYAQVNTPASFVVEDGGAGHRANVLQTVQVSTPATLLVEDGGAGHRANVLQTVQVNTPRPLVYQQQGVLAQQEVISGQPLVYQQNLGISGQQATLQVSTPSSAAYEGAALLKPYGQSVLVTPKPASYHRFDVSSGGIQQQNILQGQSVSLKPNFIQDVLQVGGYGQKISAAAVGGGYTYDKPSVAFELPSKNAYLPPAQETVLTYPQPAVYAQNNLNYQSVGNIVATKPISQTVYTQQVVTPRPAIYAQQAVPIATLKPLIYEQNYVTPKPVVYNQEIVQTVQQAVPEVKLYNVTPRPIFRQRKPVVVQSYATAKPVVYKQDIVQTVVTPRPIVYQQPPISLKPVFYQKEIVSPRPVIVQQQVASPRPVIYQQEIVTPRPIIYQQELSPVVTPKPIIYQQQYVTPRPVVYEQKQQVYQQTYVTPKPVVYQQQVVTAKPVVYQQVQQIVTPRPVVYEQKQEIVSAKPVVYQQEIVQPVAYQQQVVTPRPVVYQQQVVTPRPVVYQQQQQIVTAKPVVYQQQVVTPKPVVYQQQIVQPVVTPKPVVYQQQFVTPRPVVYQQQQQVVTAKPVVYEQQVVQNVVTPKPVLYQQQIVTPKPVTYVQEQVITPRPVVYQKEIVQPFVQQVEYKQKVTPVVYQQQVVTAKPTVYQQQRQQIVTPRPVVYQQEIVQPIVTQRPIVNVYTRRPPTTPKAVLYQQVFNIQTPQPITIRKKPVVYQQNVVQPIVTYQQEVVTPKPVTYQQTLITPRPVVYQQQQPIVYQQQVTPRPIVYRQKSVTVSPAVFQQEVVTAKPIAVTYQQEIVTPKPVVYQQEFVTPKPVVYQQEYVTPKPVVYQQEYVTPKPVVYQQEYVTPKPVVYQQEIVTPKPVVYQQEYVTPKPVVYQQKYVTPKPVVYQQQEVVTPKAVVYQQEIVTPRPVVYQQEIVTPRPVVYAQRIPVVKKVQPVSYAKPVFFEQKTYVTPKPVVYQEVSTPKTVVYQQNYEIPQQQITVQQDIVKVKAQRPVVYQEVSTPKTVLYQQNYEVPQQQVRFQQVTTQRPVVYQTPVVFQQRRKNIALVQTTPRPTFLQSVTSVTPTVTYQQEYQPIVVQQAPQIKIRGRVQTTPQTVYSESYERVNPGVAILQKEVYQPVEIVSTQSPIIVQSLKKVQAYSGDEYLPPAQENLEIKKLEQIEVTTARPLFTVSQTPKYGINTKIEIAPPPEGYALNIPSTTGEPATSTVYTIRPRTRVRVRPVTTTENSREYLPPVVESRRRGKGRGKTTIVSIGQVDKAEVDDQNIEVLLDKYSGKFGELSEDDKDKFVTKVIQGNERGTIKVGKEPEVSTVGYDITSGRGRSRAKIGSRKFSSTSTTTEDYEEETGVSSTTSSGKDDTQETDTGDISLATLDLKNLKIKKNKKTVIVVSQVSDANPILIGKLAGQCSCQSNKVDLRSKGRRPSGRRGGNNAENDGDARNGSNDGDDENSGYPAGNDSGDDSDSGSARPNGSPSLRGRNSPRGRNQDNNGDNEANGSPNEYEGSTTRGPSRGRSGKSRGRRPTSSYGNDGSGSNDGRSGSPTDGSNIENGYNGPNGAGAYDGENNGPNGAGASDDGNGGRNGVNGRGGRRGGARGRRPNNNDDSPYGSSGSNDGASNNGPSTYQDKDGYGGPEDTPILIGSYGSRSGGNRGGEPVYLDNVAIEDGPGNLGQLNVEILNEDGSPTGLTSTTTILPEVSSSILLPLAPSRRRPTTEETVLLPVKPSGRRIPSRSKSRVPFVQETSPLFSPITADEIASTVDYNSVQPSDGNNKASGASSGEPSKTRAGAAFDRYGPGGWRSADETLQGSVDCKRPGLFRHPKYCNKFYSCNYDPWKKRYVLSVFNCPIHLAYDSQIGACNWPSKGPACADDNLLV